MVMNNAIFGKRTLQLWEYRVSHGSLLIRSPKTESGGLATNIDIVCTGVEYLALPRYLRCISILEARPDEVSELEADLGKELLPVSVRILMSMGKRFRVVAASLEIYENQNDIFESTFK